MIETLKTIFSALLIGTILGVGVLTIALLLAKYYLPLFL